MTTRSDSEKSIDRVLLVEDVEADRLKVTLDLELMGCVVHDTPSILEVKKFSTTRLQPSNAAPHSRTATQFGTLPLDPNCFDRFHNYVYKSQRSHRRINNDGRQNNQQEHHNYVAK